MIFFLVPVFNEEENLPKLAKSFMELPFKETIHFVFVDDFSSDNSVELIETLFENSRFKVITKDKNQGPGHSFNLGFEWILQNCQQDDHIVTLEADGTSDLSILPTMLALSEQFQYDLVLASVYAQGGGFEQTSLFRKSISFVANILLRAIFNVKILTLSSFYRVYKAGLLHKLKDRYKVIIGQNGFVSMLEVIIKAIELNANIIEVPMKLKSEQRVGRSKMKIYKTSKEYLKYLFKFKR